MCDDTSDFDGLLGVARALGGEPEVRRTALGFIGYQDTKPGDKVLIGIESMVDTDVVNAVASALREMGAKVDIAIVDAGPDRMADELDEVRQLMRREPRNQNPHRGGRVPWIRELAKSQGYSLLLHGRGGPVRDSPHREEGFPWVVKEHLLSECNVFPRELHTLINQKSWSRITDNAGGRIHLTDPEGTDLSTTILPGPLVDGQRYDYGMKPKWGHLMAHAPTPVEPNDDTHGVIAGTTNHYSRAFPRIELTFERAKLMQIDGGGALGDAWRELIDESSSTQYPCFPEPGLFWLWEIAIGTNPKVVRPRNVAYLSSLGFEWERRRAGVIHCGVGTRLGSSEEFWAGERGLLYGHMHVHLLAPTLIVETTDGREVPVIKKGRLSVYDDPDVRDCAAQYGDPDLLLREDWIPRIPGITVEGSYEEYAKDPARWIYNAE